MPVSKRKNLSQPFTFSFKVKITNKTPSKKNKPIAGRNGIFPIIPVKILANIISPNTINAQKVIFASFMIKVY